MLITYQGGVICTGEFTEAHADFLLEIDALKERAEQEKKTRPEGKTE